MNFAAEVSFSVILSLVICGEVFPSYVSAVLLELLYWPGKGSQPQSVRFLKLVFGQLASLSCFHSSMLQLDTRKRARGFFILILGSEVLIFGNNYSSLC